MNNNEQRMLFVEGTSNSKNTGDKLVTKQLGSIVEFANHGSNIVPLTDIIVAPNKFDYLVDTDIAKAKIYKEGTDAPEDAMINLESIPMPQSRMVTATVASKQVIDEVSKENQKAAANLLDEHTFNQLEKRFTAEMEFQMFNSPAGKSLADNTSGGAVALGNILKYNVTSPKEMIAEKGSHSSALSYAMLMDAYTEFLLKQSDNLDGAIWVFNKFSFVILGKVKDGNGNYVLTGWDKDLPKGAVGRLFGVPVLVTPTFNNVTYSTAGEAVVLMNPKKAYAFTVSKEMEKIRIGEDTIQSLKGTYLYKAEIGVSGNVVNPRAIVICKASSTSPA